jgi:hypothetical protein
MLTVVMLTYIWSLFSNGVLRTNVFIFLFRIPDEDFRITKRRVEGDAERIYIVSLRSPIRLNIRLIMTRD